MDEKLDRLKKTRERMEELRLRDLELNELIGAAILEEGDPAALRAERRAVREETEDLGHVTAKLSGEVREEVAALRLQRAKIEQREIPLNREVERLVTSRIALFTEGLAAANARKPCEGFGERLNGLEEEIVQAAAAVAAVQEEARPIALALSRYEAGLPVTRRGAPA